MTNLLAQFSPFDAFMLICLVVGGFFAVRNGSQTQLAKFQEGTIKALKERIEVLEAKATDLEKQNIVQQHIIDTITSALKQKGMIITIDGDMVTISDKSGSSTHRKRSTTAHVPLARDKKEEE